MTGWTAVRENGTALRRGDEITDFRGDIWEFLYASAPRVPGKSGKVVVTDSSGGQREFYDDVFDLRVLTGGD